MKQKKFRRTWTKFKAHNYIRPHYQELCLPKNQLLPQNYLNIASLVHKIGHSSFSKAHQSRSVSFYERALSIIRNKAAGRFIRANKPRWLLKITRQFKSELRPKKVRYCHRFFLAWNKVQRHVTRYRFRKLNIKNLRGSKPFRRSGKFFNKRRPKYISWQAKFKR